MHEDARIRQGGVTDPETIAAAPPGRARQALKSQRTRDLLVASAVSLIRRGGLATASAKRIAQDAGVTWGAAQHHFGSKEHVLEAVVAQSHARFMARFAEMDAEQPLPERLRRFVELMWAHYRSDLYLATIEVIMAERAAGEVRLPSFEWPNPDHARLMSRVFGDCPVSDEARLEALVFAHCLLTGLSIQGLLDGEAGRVDAHLRRCMAIMAGMLRLDRRPA